MKKFLKIFLLILLFYSFIQEMNAEVGDDYSRGYTTTPPATSQNSTKQGKTIKVKVTEKIPGANCSSASGSTDEHQLFECSVSPGFSSLKGMISEIIKFFTAIAALCGILFIVINGILLSMGSTDSGKSSVKGRIIQGIIGLILLLMSGLILNLIAPWIYT